MRKYIIIALLLLVGGVGASLYLIPNDQEVVVMKAKDEQAVDLGNVDVEAEYNQGRRTFPIISALADKRVAAGDRPGAIKVLEEYVAANTADVNGHKKLAEQYQLAGNQKGFNEQLEIIAAAAPTEANLRMLSDIYNASKEYAKQVDVLKKMLEVTQGNNPQVFVDLATIQVVVGDSDDALKTVQELKAKHPTFSSYAMTRIMVSVLAAKGQADDAFAAAKGWMDIPNAPVPAPATNAALPPVADTGASPVATAAAAADSRPTELADLCNILHYSGYANKAVELVELHKDLLDREPQLVLAYVNASVTAGKTETAYGVLKKMDDADTMIAALYPPYLSLTLKREDMTAAEAIANKLTITGFTEEQALATIETARAHDASSVMNILTKRFSDATFAQDKPVLTAVIAILTKDKTQDAKIEAALNAQLTSTQRVSLAESCARAGKTACFDAIIKQYPPLEQMSPTQVAEYAQLYIIANRAGEKVDAVGALAKADHAAVDVVTAHLRLAAAAGRKDVMSPWLQANANNIPISQLQELFYLANDRKHGEVASDIAERLYARDPSPMNRDILASAYVTEGKYEKAMPLLRDQMKTAGADDGLYLATLSKLARNDATARKELGDYAQSALQQGRGDERQKMNYVYVLINNGRKQEATAYAKTAAASGNSEWKKLYAQLTAKPKAGAGVKLSREQMIAMAQSKTISNANKRQVAFNLLNAGHKDDAMVVFMDLAKDKGPDSQEVKDLLYLWGGKLNGEQLAWVQRRAATASPYDKDRWASLINNAADDRSVMAYVSSTPDALYNADLRQKYFRILANTGTRQNYEVAMRNWVDHTTEISALLDYAKIAQNSGYREAAVHGYERVLALDPNNPKALSQLAAIEFSKGKFSTADKKLNRYIMAQNTNPDLESNPAEAHFYKAQLLRRQGKKEQARTEFAYVLQLSSHTGASTPDALSRIYTSQFHLGQHTQAKAGFEQLLEQYPNDKGILADYMSALIEYNYLDEATRIANQYDKTSPYYRKGSSLVGRSQHTSSIQQFSSGREMKISFAQPIEDYPPINIEAVKKLPWVEQSEVGYDSISISAKPGYVVRYVPTSQQQFVVVAAPVENAPALELQRQQDLRLQLLYARIEQNSGQLSKARERLAVLKQYYPNDPQLLAYEASVESARGNTRQAVKLIEQAKTVAPENEDITLQAQNIRRIEGGNYAKLDHEYRMLGDNNEHITTFSSAVRVGGGQTEIGLTAQNDFLEADNIRRASDGTIGDYETSRQRGELYAAYKFDNNTRAQASLFANNKDVGGGAYLDFDSPLGRTQLIGEYQRPYWDFVEAVYEHATRDRIGVKNFVNLRPTTTLGVEASYNNYNIDLRDDVAETVLVRVNAVQQIQPKTATQPYLGIGYGFDGEYLTNGKPDVGIDAQGNGYYLLPVRTREVHALTGIYSADWSEQTHALLIGGAAYDRINGGFSPLAEGRIDHDLSASWQIGARARYAQETNNTDNQALNLGADVLYKF